MAEIGRCKTCKWWDREHPTEGTFVLACLNEKNAGLDDDTDNARVDYTGPEFGCVHHEERE